MEIEVTGTRGEKGDKGDKGDRGISNKLQNWHVLLGIGMICFSILSGAEVSYSFGDLTTYTTGGTLPTLTDNTSCDFYGAYVF